MIIQTIRFKSQLPEEEIMRVAKEREVQFQALPGLLQKYYVKASQEGHYGGVYVWNSMESLQAFRTSDLAAGIPKAYGVIGAPQIEIVEVLFQLRE